MAFLSYLISGLGLGSVYAIIALGYSMVYGIAKMLNFAHGDVIMVGAYVSFFAMTLAGIPFVVSALIAVVACTLLGITIERLAYKPLRQASSLSVLITAIGVSYFLQNAAQLLWGSDTKIYPTVFPGSVSLFNGQLSVSYLTIITILTCLLIMTVLIMFINKTKTGKAMRACSECATYPSVYPTLGSMPGIRAFTAAVFGGIGSIPGAFLGGLLLGVIETFAKAYISTQLSDAIVFAVLIIVLLIKPTGLLGKKISEKV